MNLFLCESLKIFEQVRCNHLLGYEIFQNLQLIFLEKKVRNYKQNGCLNKSFENEKFDF